ncbi:unnamed protein product [Rhizoctonia solani]|uniref:Uncharacterized protein n=1 Tax=Rhizoctonia solani TaxID=456999 RepID=A0A8H3BB92_9AGAM|nr:unnamed protein product [Rhizoctonia solani]
MSHRALIEWAKNFAQLSIMYPFTLSIDTCTKSQPFLNRERLPIKWSPVAFLLRASGVGASSCAVLQRSLKASRRMCRALHYLRIKAASP